MLVTIENYDPGLAATDEQVRLLETGEILYFPRSPFEITAQERDFLLSQKQTDAAYHKNISYRPAEDLLKGIDAREAAARERLLGIMRSYSQRAVAFTASFLRRYAKEWRVDYASFRPIEEQGRDIALRSRNDLIHVDSFPSRPSNGNRLLRVFTNINPSHPRVWITSDNFETLAHRLARQSGVPNQAGVLGKVRRRLVRLLSAVGLPLVDRSDYDRFMLRFHNFLKEDREFQEKCRKDRWEFPAGSTWIVFTDTASHACLSGQYALEQTFMVSRHSLACPDKAPISILESIAGFPLARHS